MDLLTDLNGKVADSTKKSRDVRARTRRLMTVPGIGPISALTPRTLAAANAALTRSLIMRRSCSATSAKMPTVNLLALGRSAATKATPRLFQPTQKMRVRDKRSSLAITSLAPYRRHIFNGLIELGAVGLGAAFYLHELLEQRPLAAVQEDGDRATLRLHP
ncbi:UNVERIFIED_ORG: Holliday junction resolvasome RuvABC DNA-binding subunit [Bradyrhizobium japonicum]